MALQTAVLSCLLPMQNTREIEAKANVWKVEKYFRQNVGTLQVTLLLLGRHGGVTFRKFVHSSDVGSFVVSYSFGTDLLSNSEEKKQ